MNPATQRILTLDGPRQPRFVESPLPPLGPDDVLLRSSVSTLKHGTEMMAYLGRSPFASRRFDLDLRLFEPVRDGAVFYPRPLGSMVVGTVAAAGNAVRALTRGQRVFAWGPIADVHVLPAGKVLPLGDLADEQALCIDPASFALGAVLDGAIASAEKILVTGLGAIGLFAVQYCKALGATVFAASSLAPRLKLAAGYGAEAIDARTTDDLGRHVKERAGGVDAAIECSGNLGTLHHAIRAARQCGRVVCVGFYGPGDARLNLGEEFFHNRISLLASLPAFGWNNPVRGERPVHAKDLQARVIADFRAGTITPAGLLTPAVRFAEAGRALEWIADQPERVVKVLVKHD